MGSGRELVKNLGIKEQYDFSLVIKNALVLLLMSKYLKSDIYGIHVFFHPWMVTTFSDI